MKWIKKDLEEPIVNFLESNDYDKPLMVVVRCKYGSSNSTVDACRKWLEENYHAYHFDGSMGGLVDEHQLLGKLYIPHGADEQQVKVLLYNRLLEQLEPKYLKYSVALCRTLQKPTICLVNDYCYDRYDEKDLDLSNYRVMYYDGDMSISDWEDWLDWNSKQTEELRVSPEIFAFVNYELKLANKEVQSAPWIITSKLFPGLLSMIDYELECKMRFDETKYNSLSSIPKKKIISSVWSIIGFNGKEEGERIANFIVDIYPSMIHKI